MKIFLLIVIIPNIFLIITGIYGIFQIIKKGENKNE